MVPQSVFECIFIYYISQIFVVPLNHKCRSKVFLSSLQNQHQSDFLNVIFGFYQECHSLTELLSDTPLLVFPPLARPSSCLSSSLWSPALPGPVWSGPVPASSGPVRSGPTDDSSAPRSCWLGIKTRRKQWLHMAAHSSSPPPPIRAHPGTSVVFL